MNKPYVKQYNEIGECINLITKENPFINSFKSNKGNRKRPYIYYNNGTCVKATYFINKAGQLILIPTGNNRANTSSRKNKNSRNYKN